MLVYPKENLIGRIEMMRKEASVELATQELHEKLQQTIEEGQEHVAKLKVPKMC